MSKALPYLGDYMTCLPRSLAIAPMLLTLHAIELLQAEYSIKEFLNTPHMRSKICSSNLFLSSQKVRSFSWAKAVSKAADY